ncbi:translation initiation factor EIF-2B subunit, putative [Plasmodium ovale wallikeri]|uniref:Translation initiation factor EIF-2B subunit, putative n=1 Tax=Plasmodium ovale wallikeri TaxID=864142 RepID=A0A1A8ZDQ3_PLAOA|nr:translation initiation factor EIF-2B subunit, putative [Plasmodium ovale wallikeri]SBT41953.1 translation initiation factor EIF-2B subunit, putative [Plasmodium ovale wallikeri]
MVSYEDITQTLLIERIKIQYDSNSQWHKYLKYSLRNPHSFSYPDNLHPSSRNREMNASRAVDQTSKREQERKN